MQSTGVINTASTPLEIQILEFKRISAIGPNGLWSDRLGSNPVPLIGGLFGQIDDLST